MVIFFLSKWLKICPIKVAGSILKILQNTCWVITINFECWIPFKNPNDVVQSLYDVGGVVFCYWHWHWKRNINVLEKSEVKTLWKLAFSFVYLYKISTCHLSEEKWNKLLKFFQAEDLEWLIRHCKDQPVIRRLNKALSGTVPSPQWCVGR